MFSLFHIKWYFYCCREFLVRLHTTPFLGLLLFVLPVVFPLLSLYIYICIYIFVYILFFGSWIAPFAKPILLIYLELFLLHLEPLFLFRFPILHCISACGFSRPKVAAFGEFGLLLLKQIYVQMPVSARIHVSLCFGAFLLWIHFFFSFALLFVFGGQQKYHTSIIEFDTINCSSRDKKLRPIPSTDWLLLLSLTFKAASALIYKLILLNFVAQRVALLGLLVRLLFRARMSRKQRPQLLQHTSNTRRICCNSCPNWPICAASSEFGTLTHLMVMVDGSIAMPKRLFNESTPWRSCPKVLKIISSCAKEQKYIKIF